MSSIKNTYKEFKLSSWAIDNKMTVFVIIAILLVGGSMAYLSMPRETFPEIIETKIYVSTVNPGNSAEDIEKFITEPLEEEFKNISDVREITPQTLQDYSTILVEFDEKISIAEAKQRVKDKIDQVKTKVTWPTLSNGAKAEPNAFDLNISEEMPILNISLTGNFSTEELKDYAEHLQDKIELLAQVKEATLRGVDDKEVEVAVDIYKMTAAMISFHDMIDAYLIFNKTNVEILIVSGYYDKRILKNINLKKFKNN